MLSRSENHFPPCLFTRFLIEVEDLHLFIHYTQAAQKGKKEGWKASAPSISFPATQERARCSVQGKDPIYVFLLQTGIQQHIKNKGLSYCPVCSSHAISFPGQTGKLQHSTLSSEVLFWFQKQFYFIFKGLDFQSAGLKGRNLPASTSCMHCKGKARSHADLKGFPPHALPAGSPAFPTRTAIWTEAVDAGHSPKAVFPGEVLAKISSAF